MLNEVANDGVEALLFGDVEGERSAAEVSGKGEAQQRLRSFGYRFEPRYIFRAGRLDQ